MSDIKNEIIKAIGIKCNNISKDIDFDIIKSEKENGYTRQLIHYVSFGDTVTAYLLIPDVVDKNPAVLVNHQHNGERHLGKSEVCGLAGNPLQAFGPVLAQKGFVVLSPDSICFEELCCQNLNLLTASV